MIESLIDASSSEANRERWVRQIATAIPQSRKIVFDAERAAATDPQSAFAFDAHGYATLHSGESSFDAGRFEIPTVGELRTRAIGKSTGSPGRLFVLHGTSAFADVATLQAFFGHGALFQVASQFNTLEAPAPSIVRIGDYFHDPTQGPRAAVSAFPGALLRHYAAPRSDGSRFTQMEDGEQIELLREVARPEIARVRNGYLQAGNIVDPDTFADVLTRNADSIRVGVHDGIEAARGFAWDGPAAEPHPRIAQVFTSTLAAGGYGHVDFAGDPWRTIVDTLLRAAYLGTLFAAASVGRKTVVLTLIGGGVFANPHAMIRAAIAHAVDESRSLGLGLDVIVNVRENDTGSWRTVAEERGGAVVEV